MRKDENGRLTGISSFNVRRKMIVLIRQCGQDEFLPYIYLINTMTVSWEFHSMR